MSATCRLIGYTAEQAGVIGIVYSALVSCFTALPYSCVRKTSVLPRYLKADQRKEMQIKEYNPTT